MLSVCIPTYEQGGNGLHYLGELLQSLNAQRDIVFEVVVSDNSKDRRLEGLCAEFAARLKIRYVRNPVRGISNNTNNAIAHASFDLIKIMYQDDLLLKPFSLCRFAEALARAHWVVSSYVSINEQGQVRRTHRPSWSHDILLGNNTIGMPSVMAIRRNDLQFDPQLRTRLDCDYYWLLHRKYGAPEFIREPLVALRYWNGSASTVQGNLTLQERPYLTAKHSLSERRRKTY